MQASPVISLSPSFSSYSNGKLAEIAARVVEEFDSDESSDEFYLGRRENSAAQRGEGGGISDNRVPEADGDEDEEEFEFAFVARDSELSSQTLADEIFQNGKIRPVYPVFNRDLLVGRVKFQKENEKENGVRNLVSSKGPKIRHPLRKLFLEERETTITKSKSKSTSTSEADELDGVTAENYCVWSPKAAAVEEEEGRCKKSSSTGCNSNRWKLKDFLHRSHSDGSKNSLVYLIHSYSKRKNENEKKVTETPAGGGKVKSAPPPLPPYHRNGSEKQRSYLPYRQDLVWFFGNVNGSRKNLQSF